MEEKKNNINFRFDVWEVEDLIVTQLLQFVANETRYSMRSVHSVKRKSGYIVVKTAKKVRSERRLVADISKLITLPNNKLELILMDLKKRKGLIRLLRKGKAWLCRRVVYNPTLLFILSKWLYIQERISGDKLKCGNYVKISVKAKNKTKRSKSWKYKPPRVWISKEAVWRKYRYNVSDLSKMSAIEVRLFLKVLIIRRGKFSGKLTLRGRQFKRNIQTGKVKLDPIVKTYIKYVCVKHKLEVKQTLLLKRWLFKQSLDKDLKKLFLIWILKDKKITLRKKAIFLQNIVNYLK